MNIIFELTFVLVRFVSLCLYQQLSEIKIDV